MNTHLICLASVVSLILSAGCATNGSRGLDDPFAPALPAEAKSEPTEVWRFIINSHLPQPEGTDDTYIDISQFDLSMDPTEMAVLRYFHAEGVDFMSVAGSVVSISEKSQSALVTRCACHTQKAMSVVFVRQTIPNLKMIKDIIGSFGQDVVTERMNIE